MPGQSIFRNMIIQQKRSILQAKYRNLISEFSASFEKEVVETAVIVIVMVIAFKGFVLPPPQTLGP